MWFDSDQTPVAPTPWGTYNLHRKENCLFKTAGKMYMICLSFNVNLCIMAAPGVKNKRQQKEYKINLQQWPPSEELQICMSELSCRFSNKLQCKLMRNLGQNKWITKSHLIFHCLSMWPCLCSGKAEGNRVQWYWLSVWLYWDDEHYDYLGPLIASVMSTDVITRCDKCKSTQSSHHFCFINSLPAAQSKIDQN